MPRLVRVASLSEIPAGSAREVMADDRVVALFNVGGVIHALDGICPHSGGPLAEGVLRETTITCPWHGWQFDVCTGRNCLNPRIEHPSYAVRVEGDDIFVELP